MKKEELNARFWENRYIQGETGWDIGQVSTPIKNFIDQLTDKSIRILVPGCGRAYEVEYLWRSGFNNVFASDVSESARKDFFSRVPDFPRENWIMDDFFTLRDSYDLILEQTFFCALHPSERTNYVKKMHELLRPEGRLAGLLFDDPLNTDHPPFGGNKAEYISLFSPYFEILQMEKAPDSIKPRENRELFFILRKN